MNYDKKGIFSVVLRVILGTIMTFAGSVKLLDSQSFLNTIRQFDLIPSWLVLPAMTFIVQSEIWLGFAFVVGFRTRTVALLLAGLLSLFILVIAVALLRGTTGDCGCFGPFDSEQIGAGVIIRDTILLGCCLWLSFQKKENLSEHKKAAQGESVDYS